MNRERPDRPDGSAASTARGSLERQRGKIGWLLLWLVGIPVPVLLGLFLLRGCT